MIKKREAVGRLYTQAQTFLITSYTGGIYIGTEDNDPEIDRELGVYYYPQPGILHIKGNAVYKEFVNLRYINVFVEGE